MEQVEYSINDFDIFQHLVLGAVACIFPIKVIAIHYQVALITVHLITSLLG